MRKKRRLISFSVIILLFAGAWFVWRSDHTQQFIKNTANKLTPAISVASTTIISIDENKIKLNSRVVIDNPSHININTNRLNYEILIDSVKVAQGAYDRPVTVKSEGHTEIEMPVDLMTKPVVRILDRFEKQKPDSAVYTMISHLQLNVPVAGEKEFTMHVSKKLPAVRIPKATVKDLDLHGLKLNKKGVDMTVEIINPNKFPLKMKNAGYTFSIPDGMTLAGKFNPVINIPALGSEQVTVHSALKEGSFAKAGSAILKDKKNTRFSYNFYCTMVSENKMLDNIVLNTEMHGNLGELKKAWDALKETKEKEVADNNATR